MEHENSPTSIQRLILDRKGDRSYDRLSRDCGGIPTPNRVQGLATREMRSFPDVETLQGLSRGLNVSVNEVLTACAITLGLELQPTGAIADALVIHGAGRLPEPAQGALVESARQMMNLAGV